MDRRVFRVTVPAGSRLRTRAVCEGRTDLSVQAEPFAYAAFSLPCEEGRPREVTVEAPEPAPAATGYTVTVTAPAPSRWYAVVSAVP